MYSQAPAWLFVFIIMKLLNLKNYQVEVSDEALLVKPIRDLFFKDESPTKEAFYTQCSIIYFMADPRSSYNYIVEDKERFEEIKKQEGLPKSYKITKDLQAAIDAYKKSVQTTSSLLLEDARTAVDKVRKFLREVDLTLLDDKGKPVYTLNTITSALKMIPQLAKDITETERLVTKELEEAGRMRGGEKGKSLFEEGF